MGPLIPSFLESLTPLDLSANEEERCRTDDVDRGKVMFGCRNDAAEGSIHDASTTVGLAESRAQGCAHSQSPAILRREVVA